MTVLLRRNNEGRFGSEMLRVGRVNISLSIIRDMVMNFRTYVEVILPIAHDI